MPYNFFSPKPGRLGVLPVPFNSGRLNTGTLPTAGTQTHNIGAYPGKCYINKAVVSAETFPTVATSCRIELYKMTGATAVALTATGASALSINGPITGDTTLTIPILSTLTDAQRTLTSADSIRVSIVTGGAPTTNPEDLAVTVELLVVE